ncbi:SapB/AmfS family lanthipeptide [Aquimarina rhabdastrellae]
MWNVLNLQRLHTSEDEKSGFRSGCHDSQISADPCCDSQISVA